MEKLKPLGQKTSASQPNIDNATTPPKKEVENPIEKVEVNTDLLIKVNGELCFEIEVGTKKLVISESKCSQLIPAFKLMAKEQKETFLMQAAIFGANPFSVPAEIYPVPFKNKDNTTTYAPVINYKKYIDFGAANPRFNGMKSGVVVENPDGNIINRSGQVFGTKEVLLGGWCEVYIKGLKEPIFRSVNLSEFEQRDNNGILTRFWDEKKGKPALMIEKVASKLAFEIAMKMPKTYIEEELPALDVEHEDISNQKAIASNDEFFNKKS